MSAASYLVNPVTNRPFPGQRALGGGASTLLPGFAALCATLIGAVVVDLPATVGGGLCCAVVDSDGAADVNNIVVNGNGHTIDGAASRTISTAGDAAVFVFDGAEWTQVLGARIFEDFGIPFHRTREVVAAALAGLPLPNQRGPYSALPAAVSNPGVAYWCSDSPIVLVESGGDWYPHGTVNAFGLQGKVNSDFTIVQNGAGAALNNDKGTLRFSRNYSGVFNQESWAVAVIEAGGAPGGVATPYTMTIGFELRGGGAAGAVPAYNGLVNATMVGGVCRHHDTRWSAIMIAATQGGWSLFKGTGTTTGSGPSTNFSTSAPMLRDRILWLQIKDDGNDPQANAIGQNAITTSFSVDGEGFTRCWTENRVTGFGNLPGGDNVNMYNAGMIINPFNSDVSMRVFDFRLTHP